MLTGATPYTLSVSAHRLANAQAYSLVAADSAVAQQAILATTALYPVPILSESDSPWTAVVGILVVLALACAVVGCEGEFHKRLPR